MVNDNYQFVENPELDALHYTSLIHTNKKTEPFLTRFILVYI
ncbi:hypothetical protein L1276_000878 [Flavobacterium sp. HSC-32F16]|nr:hypothetical protein [Flavobacterium sp. HSC-32F16]